MIFKPLLRKLKWWEFKLSSSNKLLKPTSWSTVCPSLRHRDSQDKESGDLKLQKKIPDVKIRSFFWFLGRQKLLTYCSSFSCWLLGLQYWSVRQSIQRHILKKDLDQIFLRISVHFPCEQTSLRKLQKSITMSVSSFLLYFFSISVDNLIGAPIYVSLQSSKKKSLHRIEMSISFISGLRKEQLLSQLLMEQKHICHHPHPSKPYLDCNILLVADHGTTRVLFFSSVILF